MVISLKLNTSGLTSVHCMKFIKVLCLVQERNVNINEGKI